MMNVLATQDSVPLDLAPLDHTMPRGDNESPNEYSEETVTRHPLAELLEQLQQLQDQFACLKFATHLHL